MRGKPTVKLVWICRNCGTLEERDQKQVVDEEVLNSDIDDAEDFAISNVCGKCGVGIDLFHAIFSNKINMYWVWAYGDLIKFK